MKRLSLLVLLTSTLCAWLTACSNSILRNAVEAGLETALDTPAATPTPG
jgi:hypothetical protein